MPVVILILAAALASDAQQSSSTPTPPARAVVEGCVVREREVKGHASDVGERIGYNEHFMLFAAKVLEGKAPAAATPGPAIYGIHGLTDEQLEVHVGRRVRIDGAFGSIDRGAAPADPTHANVLELTAATIRQVPGACSIPTS
jgi:hypothetical protein